MDLVFLGQEGILDDQRGMNPTVDEARDILGDWALSSSSIPADVFHRYEGLVGALVAGLLQYVVGAGRAGTFSADLFKRFVWFQYAPHSRWRGCLSAGMFVALNGNLNRPGLSYREWAICGDLLVSFGRDGLGRTQQTASSHAG